MESPRANLLLVGVGGSGKQSLSRLAAHISSMEVFQMTLRKGYGIPDMMKDLATLYMKTGVKNIGTVFLMSDAQVSNWISESFLTTLPPGRRREIPGLDQQSVGIWRDSRPLC